MTATEKIQAEVQRLHQMVPWYHQFEVEGDDGFKIQIQGRSELRSIWENIRKVRAGVDYAGKRVLDIGTRDGMWAFEAEAMGAETVIGTDIGCDGYREHSAFIKSIIGSKVGFYYNVPVEQQFERLDTFWQFNPGLFDIVQHLGVLYHLQDPLCSLRQARKCLKPGGTLLLETAYWTNTCEPGALFNSRRDVYDDATTYWAFNLAGLWDALLLCGFLEPDEYCLVHQTSTIGRVCLTARAV